MNLTVYPIIGRLPRPRPTGFFKNASRGDRGLASSIGEPDTYSFMTPTDLSITRKEFTITPANCGRTLTTINCSEAYYELLQGDINCG